MSTSSPRSPDLGLSIPAAAFSEKAFYLEEFHGRTVGIALPAAELDSPEALSRVVLELVQNETRVILFSTESAPIGRYTGNRVLEMESVSQQLKLWGRIWRGLRATGCVGLVIADPTQFASACREAAVRLGLSKLVWIDRDGGLTSPAGERVSFMHLAELRERKPTGSARRDRLLDEVERTLVAGVPAINVCSLEGLHDELFSYDGAGTLFTEERYVIVRRLGIDDYDAASDLISRGVSEGYLAPRNEEQIDLVLASGFGAFLEGLHLAGIGALIRAENEASAEVASLYTLTRFLGEGVGGHLLTHAVEVARVQGLEYVFSCTTSERVALFFERHAFRRVPQAEVSSEKWAGYSPERRNAVTCLRRDLAAR